MKHNHRHYRSKRMADLNLKQIPLFSELGQESRQEIQASLFTFHLSAGKTLFIEGDPAEYCYFIKHGILRVLRMNTDGRVQVISRLTENMPVNVISLFDRPRLNRATVEALTSVELLALSANNFDNLIARNPDFSRVLLRTLAGRVSQMTDMIAELSLYPVNVRLARFIIKLANSPQPSAAWTQEEIAAQIGTTRDVVGRILREFDQRCLIRLDRSEIILLDRQGLFKVAELPLED